MGRGEEWKGQGIGRGRGREERRENRREERGGKKVVPLIFQNVVASLLQRMFLVMVCAR